MNFILSTEGLGDPMNCFHCTEMFIDLMNRISCSEILDDPFTEEFKIQ
jgi:hypothetical protein